MMRPTRGEYSKPTNSSYNSILKQQITHKGIPIRITADLSIEALQARREWQDILRVMKENNLYPRLLYPAVQQGSYSNMKEKSKALQTSKS